MKYKFSEYNKFIYNSNNMILIIDNTKNLNKAFMTPRIISILENLNIKSKVISTKKDLLNLLPLKTNIKGIILSGGPMCLTNGCNYDEISKNILAMNLFDKTPIIGICFGFQLMCDFYGGTVSNLTNEITGLYETPITGDLTLLHNISKNPIFYFSHCDYVSKSPPGFNKMIHNKIILCIENVKLNRFGFQFHPEGSLDGEHIIKRFIELYCI